MLENIRITINTSTDQVRLTFKDYVRTYDPISADTNNIIERKPDGIFAPTPNWAVLEDKPSSSVTDIDQAVEDRHTHSNKTVIDDLSDDAGVLQYKGLPISDQAALDAKVDKVAGKSLVDDTEIAKLLTVEQDAQKNTVSSVAGRQGDVLLDKSDVGLGAVDNTADADKPVSTAVAAALLTKFDKTDVLQATGQSTEKVMSQKAVTDLVGDIESVLVAINGEP